MSTYNGQDLHYSAYGMGASNYSLGRTLWLITSELGVLKEHEYRQVIEGWNEGKGDWDTYRTEQEFVSSTEPADDYPW